MNRYSFFIITSCVGLLLPTLCCHASDDNDFRGFHAGVGIGMAHIDDDAVLIDDSNMVYKILGGYTFNEFLSFEASLLRFEDVHEFYPFHGLIQDELVHGNAINGAAVFTLPVSDRFDLNGRVGLLHWSVDATNSSSDDSGTDLSVGVGLQYKLNESLSVGIDYDAYRLGERDTQVATLALGFRF